MLWKKEELVIYNRTNSYLEMQIINILIRLPHSENHWKFQRSILVDWLKSDTRWILHFVSKNWTWQEILWSVILTNIFTKFIITTNYSPYTGRNLKSHFIK